MDFVPSFKCESCEEQIDSTFEIRQKNINYIINLRTNDNYLILKMTEEDMLIAYFEKKLTISDIQNMHKTFFNSSLFQKFVDYIKTQIEKNKLEILKINNESILLRLKQEKVEIILNKKKIDNEIIIMNIYKELKECKSNQKNMEQKYEQINHEIEKLKSLNNELKRENEEIKANINQLKEENKNLKESNKTLEEKLEKYKNMNEQNKLVLNENSVNPANELNNNTDKKIKKLNLDGINNNNIDNMFNANEKIKLSNLKTKPTLRRMNSFSNRLYTFNELSGKHLDVIKEDTEKDEQNKYKEINKRDEFKEINEENDFNKREDNDLNSLNIKINKIQNLNNIYNNKKLLRNTLSYKELPIKQVFNKRLTLNNKVLNSSKKINIDYLAHKTFTNWKMIDINNTFCNLTNRGKLNDIKEMKTKENNNNNKLIDLNQNLISNKINSYHKNISLNNPENNNDKKIQIDNYDSNYRTITEGEQYNSNKIFNRIYKEKNNYNENKIEKKQDINNKKLIIGYRNDLKFKPKNNLNNYANLIENAKESHIINSVLQCLTNVEPLVKYFLSNKEEIKINNIQQPFSNAFLEVIENLWENKLIKEYTPTNFLNIILNQKNKSFNNSNKLVIFILENLHNELNKNKDNIPTFKNSSDDNFDIYFQKFEKFFKEKYNSIIADIFYRKLDSQITCFECNNTSHRIQYGKILEFSLEEVKEYINNKNITINDCLKYYQRQDFVRDKKCDKCNQSQIMGNIKILLTCPKVLIICLKGKKDNENKLVIKDVINLNEFFYYKEKEYNYELINIMTYLEKDNCIAFCKSFVNKKWYKYFDSKIVPSSFKEININCTPHLLIYSLIEKKINIYIYIYIILL